MPQQVTYSECFFAREDEMPIRSVALVSNNRDMLVYYVKQKVPSPLLQKWSQRSDSNRRPTDYKSVALPIELRWLLRNEANQIV